MPIEEISNYNQKDLTLDVQLTASKISGSSRLIDMTGKNTFEVGLFQKNVSFGITNITINTNASLMPLVEITFKDLYGHSVFGKFHNKALYDDTAQSDKNDYSLLFDWPPPKFELTFKGYLGRPVTWTLNLKSTNVDYSSDDGSYDIKATFVPNQWGFLADIPRIYLNAVGPLKRKKTTTTDPVKNKELENTVFCLNDLLDKAITTEQTIITVSQPYLDLIENIKKLNNLFNEIKIGGFKNDQTIDSELNKKLLEGFRVIKIVTPNDYLKNIDKITTEQQSLENKKLIALLSDSTLLNLPSYNTLTNENFNEAEDQRFKNAYETSVREYIEKNLDIVDKASKVNVSESVTTKLDLLTIGRIFSRLSGDAAYILGRILQAGLQGYEENIISRETNNIIGRNFPLMIAEDGSTQIPAFGNYGIEYYELKFVKEFAEALSLGISQASSIEASLNGGKTSKENTWKQINNVELLSLNPHTNILNSDELIRTLLIRSAIAGYLTNSDDIDDPGQIVVSDVKKIVDNEIENIGNDIITNIITNETEKNNCIKFFDLIPSLFAENGRLTYGIDKNVQTSSFGTSISLPNHIENLNALKTKRLPAYNEFKRILDPFIYKNNNKSKTRFINENDLSATSLFHNGLTYVNNPNGGEVYILFTKDVGSVPSKESIKEITNKSESKDLEEIRELIKNNHVVDYEKLKSINKYDYEQTIIDQSTADIINSNEIEFSYKYVKIYNKKENIDNNIFGLLTDGSESGKVAKQFLFLICQELKNKLSKSEAESTKQTQSLFGKISEQENAIYTQMHHIFHQWNGVAKQDGTGVKEISHNELPEKLESIYSSVENGGFKYTFPLESAFLDMPKTNVANSIINFDSLKETKTNTTVLNVIQNICTKNNFLFIPIPGNANYENISEIFKPYSNTPKTTLGNFFHVMFMPTPESRSELTDGTNLVTQSNKLIKDGLNINAFKVKFGDVSNKVFKSIKAGTESQKPTAESILNLQNIVEKSNENKIFKHDCSILSVMEGRSYNMSVDMIGNSQISPTQFFYVDNSPIFGGLYQILKTSHNITPNNMSTSFEGVKMRFDGKRYGGVRPITKETYENPYLTTNKMDNEFVPANFHNSNLIEQTFINNRYTIKFKNSFEINKYWTDNYNGETFTVWFNKNFAGKFPFTNIQKIPAEKFNKFWDHAPEIVWNKKNEGINLFEFLSIHTIVINETGGTYEPKTEEINNVDTPNNPGLSYAFNSIPGTKSSYNTRKDLGNKTAYDLFHDQHYQIAHGDTLLAKTLIKTSEEKWKLNKFPLDTIPESNKITILSGKKSFISEADFFKFRGRGFIQTTGRANYLKIIDYILKYNGESDILTEYKIKWSTNPFNKDSEKIATMSTNSDWDKIFRDPTLNASIKAVNIHAVASHKYHIININKGSGPIDHATLESKIKLVAQRISGENALIPRYVPLFMNRIFCQTDKMMFSNEIKSTT